MAVFVSAVNAWLLKKPIYTIRRQKKSCSKLSLTSISFSCYHSLVELLKPDISCTFVSHSKTCSAFPLTPVFS